ncbi:21745ee3-358f-4d16-9478-8f28aee4ca86 [Thermothielavioides terrestris]|uniref:Large ribosomal subunit protein bL28m n=1 Tax=Thermothielavioides terrestris TaxID=2587410 RepID=A0A3S4BBE3_9PEZI|nr:21745ee3-358f-4d16-9478-8f28aee4ca86 [Thermothielavioides terrestris]
MPPRLPMQTCCLRASASRPTAATLPRILGTATATTTPPPRTTTPTRSFTTTRPALYKQPRVPGSDIPIPSVTAPHPEIPPYPYGPRPFYHQSNTGLYGTARIRFGNHVSEEHNTKARRKWRPNVQHKGLWSASLGVFVRTRVTTRVLRTIDKAGGLDEYLLGRTPQRVKDLGPWGWRLRWRIMQTPAVRARFAAERAALGLPPKEDAELRAEAEASLPEGAASADGLMAETDRMLEEGAEFELGGEADGAQDGFMREEKARS